jgi:hypothetical protein
MPLDGTCFYTASTTWFMLGGFLMFALATRGTDSQESPSPFFFEIGMLRLVLCAIWALVHLALNVTNAHVFFINRGSNELLAANCILGAARCVILIAQAYWHRRWCVGQGWKLLQSSAAPAALWPYYIGAYVLTSIGTAGNQAFTWHTAGPSDPSWVLNLTFDIGAHVVFGAMLHFYIRPVFIRGGIMTTFLIASVVAVLTAILGLVVQYFALGVKSAASGFDNEYGFASLSVAWGLVVVIAFYYKVTWEQLSDAEFDDSECQSTALGIDMTTSIAIVSSALQAEQQVPAILFPATSALPFSMNSWAAKSGHVSPNSETIVTPTNASMDHGLKLASVHPQPECAEKPLADSSPRSTRVSHSQIQLHRLAVGVIEMLSFSGFIFTCEWIVALSFPQLRSCGQTTSSWSEFFLSVFDLFAA